MEISTEDFSPTPFFKGKEITCGGTEKSIVATSKGELKMVMESNYSKMEIVIKDFMRIIVNMGKDCINGETDRYMKANLQTTSSKYSVIKMWIRADDH